MRAPLPRPCSRRIRKATMGASGASARQGSVAPDGGLLLTHMGESDGAFRAWGIPKGGKGGCRTRSGTRTGHGAEIRTERPSPDPRERGARSGSCSRAARRPGEVDLSSVRCSSEFVDCSSTARSAEVRGRRCAVKSAAARKVNLAVDSCRTSACGDASTPRRDLVQPAADEGAAYDDAKYGRWSSKLTSTY